MLYEFRQLVEFLLQEYTSRDLRSELSYKIFLVGDGGKHALSREERPRRSVTVWGNYCELLTIDREYMNYAIMEVKTIKNTDINALFSSITATTESLILGVNGFKRDFESRTIC